MFRFTVRANVAYGSIFFEYDPKKYPDVPYVW